MRFIFFACTIFIGFNALANDYVIKVAEEGYPYKIEVKAHLVSLDSSIKKITPSDKENGSYYFPPYYYVGYTIGGKEVLAQWKTDGFVLKKSGATGEEARKIEMTQIAMPYFPDSFDNDFGIKTMDTFKEFQLINIRELRYSDRSADSAQVCVNVQWENKSQSMFNLTINICGTAKLTSIENGQKVLLEFSRWRANDFLDEEYAKYAEIYNEIGPDTTTPATTQNLAQTLAMAVQSSLALIYSHEENAKDLVTYIQTGKGNL